MSGCMCVVAGDIIIMRLCGYKNNSFVIIRAQSRARIMPCRVFNFFTRVYSHYYEAGGSWDGEKAGCGQMRTDTFNAPSTHKSMSWWLAEM